MKTAPEQSEEYKKLRADALGTSWRKRNFSPTPKNPNIWGALMEVTTQETILTLVCMIDGSVNLYSANGGGISGAGEIESVRMKAEEFIQTAETFLKKFNRTKSFPVPEVNRVRFYALTYEGIKTAQNNKSISDENHPFYPLLRSGMSVIAEIRAITDKNPPTK